ncbi:MAG: NAD(P)/FAD-dependent oxidoreductase [Actinomycetota bacterium]
MEPTAEPAIDAVVVGAGFAGMYMLHALRQAGFTARTFDTAGDVGGTWYWNRYPGCRCDIESVQYSYQFSAELQQEWTWTERYASQPEILAYAQHVADRFDLRRDITFETRVDRAHFDDSIHAWRISTSAAGASGTNEELTARHLILGVGCLSTIDLPTIDGIDDFAGTMVHTGRWPHDGIDFAGQRAGVIGTGSSGIQSIPIIAEEADHLTVFQRTPNYVVPARNRQLSDDEMADIKSGYGELRARARATVSAFDFPRNADSCVSASPTEREQRFEAFWGNGGLPFLGVFGDLLTSPEANRIVTEWWQSKIRAVVDDPETAEALIPDGDIFGGKRLCCGTDYFETYNRDDVTLVDVSEAGIDRVTERGVVANGVEHELDVLICATGFDAMTGSVIRMDLAGPDGTTIAQKWADGPHNYLGILINGFPNLFNMQGPGSPSVFATMLTGMEHQGDWIVDCLEHMRSTGRTRVEATADDEAAWVLRVAEVAEPSLRSKCDSWYLGSNIDGKPKVFMPWIGGFPAYVDICADVIEDDWAGLEFADGKESP